MLSLLPLINSSVTTESSFLLLIISTVISSKTLNTLRFLEDYILQYFYLDLCISSEYSIKNLGSLQCFKPIFSSLLSKN